MDGMRFRYAPIQPLLEALEPRLLLSATLFSDGDADATLASEEIAGDVIILLSLPDLRGYKCLAPSTAAWGQTITVQGQVRNRGSAAAGSFVQKFYLSADTTWGDADDVYLASYNHGSLAGNSYGPIFNVSLTLPSAPPSADYLTQGTCYIGMQTDANNAVSESSETNNGPGDYNIGVDWDSLTVGTIANVELTLYRVSDASGTPNTADPGVVCTSFLREQTVRVTLQANNTGQSVPVRTVLSIFGPDNVTVVYDSHAAGQDNSADSPLDTNETDYYSFDWTIPINASVGYYDLLGAIRDANSWDLIYDTTRPGRNNGFGSGDHLLDQFRVVTQNTPPVLNGLPDVMMDEDKVIGGTTGPTGEVPLAGAGDPTVGEIDALASAAPVSGAEPLGDATPTGDSYLLMEHWGGAWSDAEKSPTNSEDDLMCWAAAAANVLEWTGWGEVSGMTNTDQMFKYFQDHWTDEGGLPHYGWNWWFTGTNLSQGWSGWSQVDVAGGGFYPSETFSNYYLQQGSYSKVMTAIDQYLHGGYGVALGVYTASGGGHAITCWGYVYDPDNPTVYKGIWVSDSDDDKGLTNPTDRLRYYDVAYSGSQWFLQNFYASNSWYIGEVEALHPGRIDLWAYASDQESPSSGLAYSIVGDTDPNCGASIQSNRYLAFHPSANWYGGSDVTVQVSDGQYTASRTFHITVVNLNDPPDAVNDSAVVAQNSTGTPIDVLANDTYLPDPPETLTVIQVGAAAHGTPQLVSGQVLYDPATGYLGPDSFTYTISDGHSGRDTATVSVTVAIGGDADLDGDVTFLDFGLIDYAYAFNNPEDGPPPAQPLKGWANGDFDGDGAITFLDYGIIDYNYTRLHPDAGGSGPDPTQTTATDQPVVAPTGTIDAAPIATAPGGAGTATTGPSVQLVMPLSWREGPPVQPTLVVAPPAPEPMGPSSVLSAGDGAIGAPVAGAALSDRDDARTFRRDADPMDLSPASPRGLASASELIRRLADPLGKARPRPLLILDVLA